MPHLKVEASLIPNSDKAMLKIIEPVQRGKAYSGCSLKFAPNGIKEYSTTWHEKIIQGEKFRLTIYNKAGSTNFKYPKHSNLATLFVLNGLDQSSQTIDQADWPILKELIEDYNKTYGFITTNEKEVPYVDPPVM